MEIQKIIKLFLFNFLFIAFNSNAQWITIENCHPETYTYSVHVGYTGPNNNTPVYEVRHMNYTVCNPTAVWAGPGSPDTPPPPPYW